MKAMIYAGMAIGDVAGEADCFVKPEVTLTFNTARDRYRFEAAIKRRTEPIDAHLITDSFRRDPGTYEFAGIRFKLVVRQSHETASVDNLPQPKFRRL